MNITLIIISIVVVIIFITFFIVMIYLIRKRKRLKTTIPDAVLNDFETAERRFSEYGGEIEPHRILWDISRERSDRIGRTDETYPGTRIQRLSQQPTRREDISPSNDTGIENDKAEPTRVERNNRRGFLGRRR